MTQRRELDVERMISLVSVARNALGELTRYRDLDEGQLLSSSEKLGNWAIDDRRVISKLRMHLEFVAEFLNSAAALATGSA